MATPTSDEIRERAVMLYMSDPERASGYGGGENIGSQQTPEDSELRSGGYFEEARNQLMRESANLTPEMKEIALRRREELKAELAEVREALGYRPRSRKAKVEALVEAAKSPEPVAPSVEAASREELEDLPIPGETREMERERLATAAALPGRRAPREYFPGRRLSVEVPEVSSEIEEESLLAAGALPRPARRERFPGRYIPELAAQRQEVPQVPKAPKPPPAHKQLSASFRRAFRSTTQKLADYERELRAQDEARRKQEREEQRELKMFAREVNLAKRKRIILARATADVERERSAAEAGFGGGETPLRGLASAVSRRGSRFLASQYRPEGEQLPPGFQEFYAEQEGVEEENPNPYGTNFGRFPSHRYPAYKFPSGKPRKRLHFRLGEPKPGARPSRGPRIRTSWSFNEAIRSSARPPSYNKRAVPYSFELVRPEDRELRQAQGRVSE